MESKNSSVRTKVNRQNEPRNKTTFRYITSDSKLLLEPLFHDYYIAPEVLLREKWKTTYSSDIWALGVILLELHLVCM